MMGEPHQDPDVGEPPRATPLPHGWNPNEFTRPGLVSLFSSVEGVGSFLLIDVSCNVDSERTDHVTSVRRATSLESGASESNCTSGMMKIKHATHTADVEYNLLLTRFQMW